jgi:hypothetical protein
MFRGLKCRSEDNVRMDLREIGWDIVDWIHLAYNRGQWQALVNRVMNLHFPYNVNFLNIFSRILLHYLT